MTARLAALAAEYALSDRAVEQLSTFLDVLATDPTAPTTVTDPRMGVDVHVADSLSALVLGDVSRGTQVADLGAGAGVPGLVLAAARPAMQVTLVESVGKKCEFMRRAAELMELDNVDAVHARAEGWPAGIARHDVVTARALAPLTMLVEYAAPLLQPGGTLVAWKGHRDPAEEADGTAAAEATGMQLREARAVQPFPKAEARTLYVYVKVRETPEKFPRREGMARKRPIRA